MGRPGRPRKPMHLKILAGTYRKDRAKPAPGRGPTAPTTPPARMAPPAGIGTAAKREWRRIVSILHEMGTLSTADRAILAAYCQTWQRWLECEACIEEHGATFQTPQGQLCPRPEVGMAVRHAAMLRRFASDLGLSPAARPRVAEPAPTPTEDATESLLFGKSRD